MLDDPHERIARPIPGWAGFTIHPVLPDDPALRASLREWDWVGRALLGRAGLSAATRVRLEDGLRIAGEIARVLAGEEPGEGTAAERTVWAVRSGGRVQAIACLFPTPRAVFVELVASAPWNLLGPGEAIDGRTVRGAGSALLAHADAWSRVRGTGGRVALQAENPRARAFYERLGFTVMTPDDAPLQLVPRGDRGHSPEIRRVAGGRPGPEEERSPWMVRDPQRRATAAGSAAVPARATAAVTP